MDAIYVYNSPTMIEKISKVFVQFLDQTVKNKIVLVNKKDGEGTVTNFKKLSFRNEL